jgi:hypothetical protein
MKSRYFSQVGVGIARLSEEGPKFKTEANGRDRRVAPILWAHYDATTPVYGFQGLSSSPSVTKGKLSRSTW